MKNPEDSKGGSTTMKNIRDLSPPVAVLFFIVWEVMWPQMGKDQERLNKVISDLALITERQSRLQDDFAALAEDMRGDVADSIDKLESRVTRLEAQSGTLPPPKE